MLDYLVEVALRVDGLVRASTGVLARQSVCVFMAYALARLLQTKEVVADISRNGKVARMASSIARTQVSESISPVRSDRGRWVMAVCSPILRPRSGNNQPENDIIVIR